MMAVITGKTRPDKGEVWFDGAVDLTRHDEAVIASLGVGRKFQKPIVFENRTVGQNLLMALRSDRRPWAALTYRSGADDEGRLAEIVRTVGLEA